MDSRSGFTKIELVVSAILLSTLFGLVATVLPRLDRIWMSSRQYQLANQELMNQMETLLCLNPSECKSAIDSLTISPPILEAIPESTLTGTMEKDSLGFRVILTLQLPPKIRVAPLVLVGFLVKEESQ